MENFLIAKTLNGGIREINLMCYVWRHVTIVETDWTRVNVRRLVTKVERSGLNVFYLRMHVMDVKGNELYVLSMETHNEG